MKTKKFKFITGEERHKVVTLEHTTYDNYLNLNVDGTTVAYFVKGLGTFMVDKDALEELDLELEFKGCSKEEEDKYCEKCGAKQKCS